MSRNTERSRADSGRGQMNRCQNCNSYISFRFARVFGNNDDQVHACINCTNLNALRDGNAGLTDE